jgi:predicted nucleic-acid-binding Zn-ribbon protein
MHTPVSSIFAIHLITKKNYKHEERKSVTLNLLNSNTVLTLRSVLKYQNVKFIRVVSKNRQFLKYTDLYKEQIVDIMRKHNI